MACKLLLVAEYEMGTSARYEAPVVWEEKNFRKLISFKLVFTSLMSQQYAWRIKEAESLMYCVVTFCNSAI
ncbi:hypothetical protein MUK42_13041 [Musa troglodytarum]|uniref:Uncharacterized protein n=1 Tax=Musa troglodytarum TaxID=320322 RepID=A0A9E7HWD3_9LILI|nr:hypothetical protein MUK42_13041 [Musa troglodytarum]